MRADVYLTVRGSARSRESAKRLIESGAVAVDGTVLTKPSAQIDESTEHEVLINGAERYVSRGGIKLEAALDTFGIDVRGMSAADIGASTGGFTDCLLKRGALRVYAADAGHGQLDASLASDGRVTVIEGFNARSLCAGERGGIAEGLDIAVMDVSFISQTLIIPGLPMILRDGGCFVSLIKPQFEAGRGAVGKGGIVRDGRARALAVRRVTECASGAGFCCRGLMTSPLTGGDGNTEYLAAFILGGSGAMPDNSEIIKIVEGGRPWLQ